MNKPPIKKKNIELRSREYLSIDEINMLCKVARESPRNSARNEALVLLMHRHALRVGETTKIKWNQLDFKNKVIHVNRIKCGIASIQPLQSSVLRILTKLKKISASSYVFSSERGGPLSSRTVRSIIKNLGEQANLPIPIHPHMLRHSTGYYLANKGQDTRAIQVYMGHVSISNTAKYTEVCSDRFKNFWDDVS